MSEELLRLEEAERRNNEENARLMEIIAQKMVSFLYLSVLLSFGFLTKKYTMSELFDKESVILQRERDELLEQLRKKRENRWLSICKDCP